MWGFWGNRPKMGTQRINFCELGPPCGADFHENWPCRHGARRISPWHSRASPARKARKERISGNMPQIWNSENRGVKSCELARLPMGRAATSSSRRASWTQISFLLAFRPNPEVDDSPLIAPSRTPRRRPPGSSPHTQHAERGGRGPSASVSASRVQATPPPSGPCRCRRLGGLPRRGWRHVTPARRSPRHFAAHAARAGGLGPAHAGAVVCGISTALSTQHRWQSSSAVGPKGNRSPDLAFVIVGRLFDATRMNLITVSRLPNLRGTLRIIFLKMHRVAGEEAPEYHGELRLVAACRFDPL